MRFVTVEVEGRGRLGLLDGEQIYLYAPLARITDRERRRGAPPSGKGAPATGRSPAKIDDLLSFIERGSVARAREALRLGRRLHAQGRGGRVSVPLGSARLLAPLPRPRKNLFCIGRNYAEHAREGGNPVPEAPVFFTKPPTCVVGPGAAVVHHAVTQALDYEVELAVIVGTGGRDIPAGRALNHVFGYTILNDITARDLQRRHNQWFKGKSLDGFAPMGPAVVHRSLVRDPQSLGIRLRVNGDLRQDSSTREMLLSVAQVIEALSAAMTLEPGDIIGTGTPEGTAMGRTPPGWLRPGDVVEAEIDGVGRLENRIVAP